VRVCRTESRAARRWLAAHGASYARLDPVYLGDDLYSRQPICQAVGAAGGHFLFVCKPSSHPKGRSRNDPNAVIHALYQFLDHMFSRMRRNVARTW
jgi:hypothetical protein